MHQGFIDVVLVLRHRTGSNDFCLILTERYSSGVSFEQRTKKAVTPRTHARDTPPPWANHGPKRSEKGNACPKVSLAPLPWPGRLDSRKSGVIASRIKALHRECRTLAGRERGENDTHSCDRASTQRLKFRFLTTQCLFYDHCESFFQMLFRRIVKFENPDFKCRASLK